MRRFDTIVTISERMRARLLEKRLPKDRLAVVRNWVDLSQVRPLTGPNRFRAELGLSDRDFVVLYAGQIGAKQALHLVLEVAEQLMDTPGLYFVLAGDGPLKARYRQQYGGLANVRFLPLQPEDRLCELLNLADLHILPQDGAAADLVLPSKLGGMLASGRPVLVQANRGTELYQMLEGVVKLVPAGDVDALAKAIVEAMDRENDTSGQDQLAALFDRDHLLPSFHDLICGRPSATAVPVQSSDVSDRCSPGARPSA